jgi:hypothetical protein
MLKKTLIILIVIVVPLSAVEFQKLSIRGSVSKFWNEGWEDKFFIPAFSESEYQHGIPDFNRTLDHMFYVNPEIWYTLPISDRFALAICGKYESLHFDLYDDVYFSWLEWDKNLIANLNFYSIGTRLIWMIDLLHPYLGGSIGYCHGSLFTSHVYEVPEVFKNSVKVDGDGGGLFYDLTLGANIPFYSGMSVFLEGGIRFSPGWKRFDSDEVKGETNRYT